MFLAASADVFLELCESALAAYLFMIASHSVHRHPDRIGADPGEILLGIGSDCDRKETYGLGSINDVIDGPVTLPPQSRLPSLEIEESRTCII